MEGVSARALQPESAAYAGERIGSRVAQELANYERLVFMTRIRDWWKARHKSASDPERPNRLKARMELQQPKVDEMERIIYNRRRQNSFSAAFERILNDGRRRGGPSTSGG